MVRWMITGNISHAIVMCSSSRPIFGGRSHERNRLANYFMISKLVLSLAAWLNLLHRVNRICFVLPAMLSHIASSKDLICHNA